MKPYPMPISRRRFLLCFVALCVAFTPAFIFALWAHRVEPASALILYLVGGVSRPLATLLLFYIGVYIGIFILFGIIAYALARLIPHRVVRGLILLVFLALPIASSFARVVHSEDNFYSSGTYTFWGAVHRYLEVNRIAGFSVDANLTGRWWFQNYVDGHQAEIVIYPDHTFTDLDGTRIGVWDIDDEHLVMRHEHRSEHSDYWQLPVVDHCLHGVNTPGQRMALWRLP